MELVFIDNFAGRQAVQHPLFENVPCGHFRCQVFHHLETRQRPFPEGDIAFLTGTSILFLALTALKTARRLDQ